VQIEGDKFPIASGRGIWSSVKAAEWQRCREINREINLARLQGWGITLTPASALSVSDEDDLTN
jgi:hypothetical protein